MEAAAGILPEGNACHGVKFDLHIVDFARVFGQLDYLWLVDDNNGSLRCESVLVRTLIYAFCFLVVAIPRIQLLTAAARAVTAKAKAVEDVEK